MGAVSDSNQTWSYTSVMRYRPASPKSGQVTNLETLLPQYSSLGGPTPVPGPGKQGQLYPIKVNATLFTLTQF